MAALARRPRRPNGVEPEPLRSFRASDRVWQRARRQAAYDGMTISRVLNLFLRDYGEGRLSVPQRSKGVKK